MNVFAAPITLDSIEEEAIMARAELQQLLREAQTEAECEAIVQRARQIVDDFERLQRAAWAKSRELER